MFLTFFYSYLNVFLHLWHGPRVVWLISIRNAKRRRFLSVDVILLGTELTMAPRDRACAHSHRVTSAALYLPAVKLQTNTSQRL